MTQAQNHDYNWYFGGSNQSTNPNVGSFTLTFKHSPPKVFNEKKKMEFFNAYSTFCSDSTGNILFYTNGISIHNKAHTLMENGDTINPGKFWDTFKKEGYGGADMPFVIPAPGKPNHYYLIHLATIFTDDFYKYPLYSTLVDMNANNGLGKVVTKNQIMLKPQTDSSILVPVAIKHGNGRDWWIITGIYDVPLHYVFLVSPSGISKPIKQLIGPPFPDWEGGANNAFTPDGSTYIRTDGHNGLRIYDFDRCTGRLNNLRIMPYTKPFYTYYHAISPNNQYLYGEAYTTITQIDLEVNDIGTSLDTVAIYDGFAAPGLPWETTFGLFNLGPDGKIYTCPNGSTTGIHTINKPDLPGPACDVQQHSIVHKFNYGNIPRYPNYRLGRWQDSPCDSLPFTTAEDRFTATSYEPQRVIVDTSYRLLTPVPDQSAPPGIYFTRKNRPDPPERHTWWIEQMDRNPLLLQEVSRTSTQILQKQ